ncbi:MAG: nucleotidyltransferase family protein [Lachnospiraceae bacterium]|nr:nucleotidyltransferase family protein [Lachnospiraceae bacterium]
MKITAITAEFNPFHKGHLIPLKYAKSALSSDYCIAIMSPSFVQRGEGAFFSKQNRVEMALKCGFDCVLELPHKNALQSAEGFCTGAIELANHTNIITDICFGSEYIDLEVLKDIANLLTNESEEYKTYIKDSQKKGASYAKAVFSYLESHYKLTEKESRELSSPNSILALEYLKAINKTNSKIIPHSISREKGSYHSNEVSYSAEYIRKNYDNLEAVKGIIPAETYDDYKKLIHNNEFITINDFSDLLNLSLINYFSENMPENDLELRIKNNLDQFLCASQFIELIKTKDKTYSSISRKLFRLLLGIDKLNYDSINYIRVLGFNKSSSNLVSMLKESSDIPVIINTAKDSKELSQKAREEFNLNIKAEEIYKIVLKSKSKKIYKNEFSEKYPIIK